MGLFAKIFGTEKALTETIGAVRDGLDALVYTPEEKAVDAARERAAAREMVVGWMQATSGQNLARRWLAVVITSTWLGQYLVAQAFTIFTIWLPVGRRVAFRETAELMASYAESMNGAVMLILGFYFAAPHMDKIVGVAMDRFSKTPKLPATEGG